MLTTELCRDAMDRALGYEQYLAHAQPHERAGWEAFGQRVKLSEDQRRLVGSFTRRMPVLVVSGSWCGDCAQQVPILAAFARENPLIELRLLERGTHPPIDNALTICGGARVPVVVFMNEDHEFVALAGDRTLARYRALASRQLGPSCPLPGAHVDHGELADTLTDWLNEFERVALLLRLSPKLRQRHGD